MAPWDVAAARRPAEAPCPCSHFCPFSCLSLPGAQPHGAQPRLLGRVSRGTPMAGQEAGATLTVSAPTAALESHRGTLSV